MVLVARRRAMAGALLMGTLMIGAGCTTDAPGGVSTASASGAAGVGKQLPGQHGTTEDLVLTPEQVTAASKAGAGQTIGIVAPLSAEYLSNVVDGAKQAAEPLGMKTQVVDYDFDATKGVSGIESLVSQGVKYMVVVLTDPPAMIGAVKAAQAAGVTVVQFAGAQVADEAGGYSVAIDDKDLGTAAGDAAAVDRERPWSRADRVARLPEPAERRDSCRRHGGGDQGRCPAGSDRRPSDGRYASRRA